MPLSSVTWPVMGSRNEWVVGTKDNKQIDIKTTCQTEESRACGPVGAGRVLKGAFFSPSVCAVNYCETVVVWHNSPKAGTDGLVPPPPCASACSGGGVGPRWVGGRRGH